MPQHPNPANPEPALSLQSIDPGQQFTWEHSNLEANKPKNRYANVIAYDHSRVILQPLEGGGGGCTCMMVSAQPVSASAPSGLSHCGGGYHSDRRVANSSSGERVSWAAPTKLFLAPYPAAGIVGSDYINANYVDGYRRQNAYIATQGPLPETFGDFWRMVWEQRSATVVMMTRLEEKSRVRTTGSTCPWHPEHWPPFLTHLPSSPAHGTQGTGSPSSPTSPHPNTDQM